MNDAPNTWIIQRVVSLARQTLATLREEHGQVIDDDAELLAALADEGVDVNAVLARLGRAALDAAADVEAANARIEALCARRDRHARREKAMRDTLLAAMQAIGLRKHSDPEFSVSWHHGKAKLLITAVDALPGNLVSESVVRSPHRAEIRAALDAGQDVPGATLSNAAPVLTLRPR